MLEAFMHRAHIVFYLLFPLCPAFFLAVEGDGLDIFGPGQLPLVAALSFAAIRCESSEGNNLGISRGQSAVDFGD